MASPKHVSVTAEYDMQPLHFVEISTRPRSVVQAPLPPPSQALVLANSQARRYPIEPQHAPQHTAQHTMPPALYLDIPFEAQTRTGEPFLVYHVCKSCHQPRSKSYHAKHPIRPGELPGPSICHRCEPSTDNVQRQVRMDIPFRHVLAPQPDESFDDISHKTTVVAGSDITVWPRELPLDTASTILPESSISQHGAAVQPRPAPLRDIPFRHVFAPSFANGPDLPPRPRPLHGSNNTTREPAHDFVDAQPQSTFLSSHRSEASQLMDKEESYLGARLKHIERQQPYLETQLRHIESRQPSIGAPPSQLRPNRAPEAMARHQPHSYLDASPPQLRHARVPEHIERHQPYHDSSSSHVRNNHVKFASRDNIAPTPPPAPSDTVDTAARTEGMSRYHQRPRGRDFDGTTSSIDGHYYEYYKGQRGRISHRYVDDGPVEGIGDYQPQSSRAFTRALAESPSRERAEDIKKKAQKKRVTVEVESLAHGPYRGELSPTPSMEVLTSGSQVGEEVKSGRGDVKRDPNQPGWFKVTNTKQYISPHGRPYEVVKEGIILEERDG